MSSKELGKCPSCNGFLDTHGRVRYVCKKLLL
ncbi:MAG: hypothetical protein JW925_06630 [Syntrophaceae bacterium]|nr:hypothetical protein [Syntrophaceae bacterium]